MLSTIKPPEEAVVSPLPPPLRLDWFSEDDGDECDEVGEVGADEANEPGLAGDVAVVVVGVVDGCLTPLLSIFMSPK